MKPRKAHLNERLLLLALTLIAQFASQLSGSSVELDASRHSSDVQIGPTSIRLGLKPHASNAQSQSSQPISSKLQTTGKQLHSPALTSRQARNSQLNENLSQEAQHQNQDVDLDVSTQADQNQEKVTTSESLYHANRVSRNLGDTMRALSDRVSAYEHLIDADHSAGNNNFNDNNNESSPVQLQHQQAEALTTSSINTNQNHNYNNNNINNEPEPAIIDVNSVAGDDPTGPQQAETSIDSSPGIQMSVTTMNPNSRQFSSSYYYHQPTTTMSNHSSVTKPNLINKFPRSQIQSTIPNNHQDHQLISSSSHLSAADNESNHTSFSQQLGSDQDSSSSVATITDPLTPLINQNYNYHHNNNSTIKTILTTPSDPSELARGSSQSEPHQKTVRARSPLATGSISPAGSGAAFAYPQPASNQYQASRHKQHQQARNNHQQAAITRAPVASAANVDPLEHQASSQRDWSKQVNPVDNFYRSNLPPPLEPSPQSRMVASSQNQDQLNHRSSIYQNQESQIDSTTYSPPTPQDPQYDSQQMTQPMSTSNNNVDLQDNGQIQQPTTESLLQNQLSQQQQPTNYSSQGDLNGINNNNVLLRAYPNDATLPNSPQDDAHAVASYATGTVIPSRLHNNIQQQQPTRQVPISSIQNPNHDQMSSGDDESNKQSVSSNTNNLSSDTQSYSSFDAGKQLYSNEGENMILQEQASLMERRKQQSLLEQLARFKKQQQQLESQAQSQLDIQNNQNNIRREWVNQNQKNYRYFDQQQQQQYLRPHLRAWQASNNNEINPLRANANYYPPSELNAAPESQIVALSAQRYYKPTTPNQYANSATRQYRAIPQQHQSQFQAAPDQLLPEIATLPAVQTNQRASGHMDTAATSMQNSAASYLSAATSPAAYYESPSGQVYSYSTKPMVGQKQQQQQRSDHTSNSGNQYQTAASSLANYYSASNAANNAAIFNSAALAAASMQPATFNEAPVPNTGVASSGQQSNNHHGITYSKPTYSMEPPDTGAGNSNSQSSQIDDSATASAGAAARRRSYTGSFNSLFKPSASNRYYYTPTYFSPIHFGPAAATAPSSIYSPASFATPSPAGSATAASEQIPALTPAYYAANPSTYFFAAPSAAAAQFAAQQQQQQQQQYLQMLAAQAVMPTAHYMATSDTDMAESSMIPAGQVATDSMYVSGGGGAASDANYAATHSMSQSDNSALSSENNNNNPNTNNNNNSGGGGSSGKTKGVIPWSNIASLMVGIIPFGIIMAALLPAYAVAGRKKRELVDLNPRNFSDLRPRSRLLSALMNQNDNNSSVTINGTASDSTQAARFSNGKNFHRITRKSSPSNETTKSLLSELLFLVDRSGALERASRFASDLALRNKSAQALSQSAMGWNELANSLAVPAAQLIQHTTQELQGGAHSDLTVMGRLMKRARSAISSLLVGPPLPQFSTLATNNLQQAANLKLKHRSSPDQSSITAAIADNDPFNLMRNVPGLGSNNVFAQLFGRIFANNLARSLQVSNAAPLGSRLFKPTQKPRSPTHTKQSIPQSLTTTTPSPNNSQSTPIPTPTAVTTTTTTSSTTTTSTTTTPPPPQPTQQPIAIKAPAHELMPQTFAIATASSNTIVVREPNKHVSPVKLPNQNNPIGLDNKQHQQVEWPVLSQEEQQVGSLNQCMKQFLCQLIPRLRDTVVNNTLRAQRPVESEENLQRVTKVLIDKLAQSIETQNNLFSLQHDAYQQQEQQNEMLESGSNYYGYSVLTKRSGSVSATPNRAQIIDLLHKNGIEHRCSAAWQCHELVKFQALLSKMKLKLGSSVAAASHPS